MEFNQIEDLSTALEFLASRPGELETVGEPVQAWCELSARYAPRGGGVPVRPPTQAGPAMLFEKVMPADRAVVVGVFGTQQRCASYIGTTHDRAAERLIEAARNPISPTRMQHAPAQEIVQTQNIDRSVGVAHPRHHPRGCRTLRVPRSLRRRSPESGLGGCGAVVSSRAREFGFDVVLTQPFPQNRPEGKWLVFHR